MAADDKAASSEVARPLDQHHAIEGDAEGCAVPFKPKLLTRAPRGKVAALPLAVDPKVAVAVHGDRSGLVPKAAIEVSTLGQLADGRFENLVDELEGDGARRHAEPADDRTAVADVAVAGEPAGELARDRRELPTLCELAVPPAPDEDLAQQETRVTARRR